MSTATLSMRKIALNYVCFYAVMYPLATHLLMSGSSEEGSGSAPIQIFQASVVLALLGLWRLGTSNFRNLLDVWTFGLVYFTCVSFYMAFGRDNPDPKLELLGGARFLAWFLFATCVDRGAFTEEGLSRLVGAFWVGSFIQCGIAIWAFLTRSGSSIYSNIYASAGSANVSGKTVVSFIVLNVFLSAYWLLIKKRVRVFWLGTILLGMSAVLFSYNRASQLALGMSLVYAFLWFVRNERLKTAGAFILFISLGVLFLCSPYGDVFLSRWNEVVDDHGSGRVTLVSAALNNILHPTSIESLLLGCGYYKMEILMYKACGLYIGTHSDFWDFITVYGLIGGVFFLWINVRLLRVGGRSICRDSIENLVLRSATLFILLTGWFTGLFQATYTFFMLITIQYYLIEQERFKRGSIEIIEVVELQLSERAESVLEENICLEECNDLSFEESVEFVKNVKDKSLNDLRKIDAAFLDLDFNSLEQCEVDDERQKNTLIDRVWMEKGKNTKNTMVPDDERFNRNKYVDVFFENAEDY